MAILSSNTVQGKLAIFAASLGSLVPSSLLSSAYADPDPGVAGTSPQIDNQNKTPERFGKAEIPFRVGRSHRTLHIAGENAHFPEPLFPFAIRSGPATDPFQQGSRRNIVLEVERAGPLTYLTFEVLLGLPGDKAMTESLVRNSVALSTRDVTDLELPVHQWPVVVAATQLFDTAGKTYGEPKLEIVRGSDRLQIKIALNDAELEAFGEALDHNRISHDPRTGSRENVLAWAEVDQKATGLLVRAINAAVRSKQSTNEDLLSLNDVTAIVNEINEKIETSIRTNESSTLKVLNGLLFDPSTVMRQLFQVDSSALEGLTAQERAAFLAIVGPKQEALHRGLLIENEESASTTIEGQASGAVGSKGKAGAAVSVGRQDQRSKAEREMQTQESSNASVAGDLKVFRFNASRAVAVFENRLRVEILTARGDLQAWPTVSQVLTEDQLITQLQTEAARVSDEIQAHLPKTHLSTLHASVLGQRSRIERGSQSVSREATSQWGIDDGRHITGRFEPPSGYTLDSFKLGFFKTLGERDTKGSFAREGNGVNYEFNIKHGPWYDKWRHQGGIRGTISYSKEVKDPVSHSITMPDTLVLVPGRSAKVADVPPELISGLESTRVALSFYVREGSSAEKLVKVDLAPGESKTEEGYQISLIGNSIQILQIKNVKLSSK